jgi:hypothetical protein
MPQINMAFEIYEDRFQYALRQPLIFKIAKGENLSLGVCPKKGAPEIHWHFRAEKDLGPPGGAAEQRNFEFNRNPLCCLSM